jgi:hypothetical protein
MAKPHDQGGRGFGTHSVVMQLRSATLESLLYPRWSPVHGDVQIQFASPGLGEPFDPRNVPGVIIILGSNDPDESTVC